ncbi:hypothetical protein [Lewinella cohaerens]|uniref:hypothetical protein n=1 Tax=Lewinella cohaerens TaxID=70995 RepID=UPI00037B9C03|nr:hypothetical protein [Lewinella cohaerens]
MKKLFYSLFTLSILLAFTACEEKERAFPEYNDLEHGAYARQLTKDGNFFLTDVDNSAIDISVEFYDENDGKDVASYSWVVEYIDKANGGATSVAPVNILTIDAGAFSTNPDTGLPFTSFGFTLPDVLSTLGLTAADVDGGSTFRFNATLTLNDGRTFTAANTGSNVISSAPFRGLFSFDADLLCTSDLEGIYEATTVGWCGDTGPTIMSQWISVGPGVYQIVDPADPTNVDAEDFSFGAYDACYGPGSTLPGGDLRIKDACNIIAPTGVSRWGEVYTFESVTTSGSTLTIVWTNDYAEGGTTTLVRTDGTDWPPLTN